MLNISFIGVGHGGGVFVCDAKQLGFPVFALNTASVDLDSLHVLSEDEKFHLKEYEGAGKDREKGKRAFSEFKEDIKDILLRTFSESDVICPVFTAGGGTGSGIGPLLTQMLCEQFPSSIICPIMFLPADNEPVRSKLNALECFSEISSIQGKGTSFFLDNNHVFRQTASVSINEKYSHTNYQFLHHMLYFNQATERRSPYANIDTADWKASLQAGGNACFVDVILDDTHLQRPEHIRNRLLQLLQTSSIFAPFSLAYVTNISMIYETPFEAGTSLDLDACFTHPLQPLDVFKGIYHIADNVPVIRFFLSGLPIPSEHMEHMVQQIKKQETTLASNQQKAQTQSFQISASFSRLKRQTTLN